jgi:hypothetical protein
VRHLSLILLAITFVGCGEQVTPKTIETPRGTVTYKEQVGPGTKFEGTLRDLSESEEGRLRQSAAKAAGFISKYVSAAQPRRDLLEDLDSAFAAWLNSSNPSKESAEEVEWIVGAALGRYCIERLPVHWAVATDHRDSEFVIVGESPASWSYPLASVRYRIEDRKTDFIGAIYEALVQSRQRSN